MDVSLTLPLATIHPIIIPADFTLCTLILVFLHLTLLHAEKQLIIQMVQQEYKIP